MVNNRSSQIISIIALLIAIIGLSLGFLSFSEVLKINEEKPLKSSEETFKVRLSSSSEEYKKNQIVPSKVSGGAKVTATNAIISERDDLKLEGVSANFTQPGQSVTYKFYIENSGMYKAYLNGIIFGTVDGADTFKVCTPHANADPIKVKEACDGITYSVKAAGKTFTSTVNLIEDAKVLDIDNFENVEVTIAYSTNSALADGDFSVKFGSITLEYSTIK